MQHNICYSVFLSLSSFYLPIVGIEGYCFITQHSRTHTHTHSVRFLWTSDRPVAETSDNTQHSQETDIHAAGGIQTRSYSKRMATKPALDRVATEIGLRDFCESKNTDMSIRYYFHAFHFLLFIIPPTPPPQ
jgi:hypothetical protein